MGNVIVCCKCNKATDIRSAVTNAGSNYCNICWRNKSLACAECQKITAEWVQDDRTGYKYCPDCYALLYATCPGCLRIGVRLWRNGENKILCSDCIEGNQMLTDTRPKCSKCGSSEYLSLRNWICDKCIQDEKSQPKFIVRECIDVRSVQRNFLIINTKTIKILVTCYNESVANFMCHALNNGDASVVDHL